MKRLIAFLAVSSLAFGVTACGSPEGLERNVPVQTDTVMQTGIEDEVKHDDPETDQTGPDAETTGTESAEFVEPGESGYTSDEEEISAMVMKIGDNSVQVAWENNESVEALRQMVSESPLIMQMSIYGGFEQVGSIGQSLPRDDKQTATKAGDIVLYSGNQMVVFYGANSWAYTRLGHISDKNDEELAELLGNGDVTITIENGGN